MTFVNIVAVIEIVLLILLLVQGEAIRGYEKIIAQGHVDRAVERKEWRLAKQRAQLKKLGTSSNPTESKD